MDAQKRPAHRPLKYETPKDLEEVVELYFLNCDSKDKPYTMSGLAYWLEIDRKTLLNYSNRDEFFPTIKKAKLRIETNQEERLIDKNTFTPGIIFNLKNNFDWHDKTEVEQSGGLDLNVNDMLNKVYGNAEPEPTSST